MPAPLRPSEAVPAASSWPRPHLSRGRLIAAGLIAYALALIATLPARVVAPRGSDAAGTIWHGAANFGGATARWDTSLAESLGSGAVAARWTLDGPATLLTGVARWRPFAGTELATVSGRTSWAQLAAAVPGLPAGCTVPIDVALDRVAAGDTHGTVRTLAGTCGTAPVRAIPRLIATFAGSGGRVTSWTDRATTLATVAVAGGVVRLHLTPAGAAVLPGPGRPGDLEFAL